MTLVVIALIVVLIIQSGIFFYSRKMKKKMKADDVLVKYGINSRADLFRALGRQDIPEEDLAKLEKIYHQDEE